jgi:hypothetical protein
MKVERFHRVFESVVFYLIEIIYISQSLDKDFFPLCLEDFFTFRTKTILFLLGFVVVVVVMIVEMVVIFFSVFKKTKGRIRHATVTPVVR